MPSVSATRKAITDRIVREAIAGYHAGERALAEAEAAFGEDDELDAVLQVVMDRRRDAERTLIRAILNFDPVRGLEHSGYRPEKKLWPARAVRCDGRLYRVAPAPDNDNCLKVGETRHDGCDAMHLAVIDLAEVSDVGTLANDPVYHPDGSRIWHIDDPMADVEEDQGEAPDRVSTIVDTAPDPAEADEDLDAEPAPKPSPRRGHPFDQADDIPRPLLHQRMTIVPPWDNGSDATLEVIVLCEPADDDDVTAHRADVPALAEAGWGSTSMKGLQVFMRVLG